MSLHCPICKRMMLHEVTNNTHAVRSTTLTESLPSGSMPIMCDESTQTCLPFTSTASVQTGCSRRERTSSDRGVPPVPYNPAKVLSSNQSERQSRPPHLTRRVNLCSTRRLLPAFRPTPDTSIKLIWNNGLLRINAEGSGCCGFHISLARQRKLLQTLFDDTCDSSVAPADGWQCASCLCMGGLDEIDEDDGFFECFVCGNIGTTACTPASSEAGRDAGASESSANDVVSR